MNRLMNVGQSTLIPVKATGNLGDEFFSTPPVVKSSLNLLKKKERHQELRDKGYLIDEKLPQEIPMDIPFYEVFDPPNENYMKIFHPDDLVPQIAYNYHSPEFEHNEIFLVSKEDVQQAESLIQQAQLATRRKESRLLKLNQQHKLEQEKEAEVIKRQQQDQAIQNAKRERSLSKKPISSPTKQMGEVPFKKYGLAIVGPKGKIKMQKEEEESQKKKTVTFADEDDVKYIPKNWKSQSEELRNKLKYDKRKK